MSFSRSLGFYGLIPVKLISSSALTWTLTMTWDLGKSAERTQQRSAAAYSSINININGNLMKPCTCTHLWQSHIILIVHVHTSRYDHAVHLRLWPPPSPRTPKWRISCSRIFSTVPINYAICWLNEGKQDQYLLFNMIKVLSLDGTLAGICWSWL